MARVFYHRNRNKNEDTILICTLLIHSLFLFHKDYRGLEAKNQYEPWSESEWEKMLGRVVLAISLYNVMFLHKMKK